jgi:hypothetical protein
MTSRDWNNVAGGLMLGFLASGEIVASIVVMIATAALNLGFETWKR